MSGWRPFGASTRRPAAQPSASTGAISFAPIFPGLVRPRVCSTGEQKALLIRIVLAGAALHADDRGSTPILLLDEVGAHLDRDRREALFDAVLALGAQVWITGTEPESFAALGDRAQRFAVADGAVAPVA